jgi:hypothetical protein
LTVRLGWPMEKVSFAFEHFASAPRSDFLAPPPPHKPFDVWPWRHNRGLSYFRKPLLVRRSTEGNDVVWGNRHLAVAVEYLAWLCLGGRLHPQCKPMKDLVSFIHRTKGESFNDRVADMFQAYPGLVVRRRVKKIGDHPIRRADGGDLGDIDTIVADPVHRRILAVETKDLTVSLTPFEVLSELKELFGDGGKLHIHVERVHWLREHLNELLAWLGVTPEPDWKVEGHVVLDRDLISPYLAANSGLRVWSIRRLQADLHDLFRATS